MRGDAEANVGEVYHACYRRLVAQLYAFTSDVSEAQDVVQEAFARALARPRAFADIDNPEAWLRTVAINLVRRRWRRRRTRLMATVRSQASGLSMSANADRKSTRLNSSHVRISY